MKKTFRTITKVKFDVKQSIIDRLRATRRENIEAVIDYMEKNYFFTNQCKKHHRYKGGLAGHAWQTYQIAQRLDAERCTKNPNAIKLDDDSIAIASLLHDICKCSGMKDIKGHGRRSVKLLKKIGLKLTQHEFFAIRFHMNIEKHKTHFLYSDAKKSQLRNVIAAADRISAGLNKGYDEKHKKQDDLKPYLRNITELDCQEVIYQVKDGWFMNIHSSVDGEIDPEWKKKIIGVSKYSTAELYGINDSSCGAIFVLERGNKKALFAIHHYNGMGGCYFSPDKEPFQYSEIKVYSSKTRWDDDYAYVACKQADGWKLVKVTQFPNSGYMVVGEGFASAGEAMKSVRKADSKKYLYEGMIV